MKQKKILNKPATELLSASVVLNSFALSQGVDIIRVHDVAEHKEALTLLTELLFSCHPECARDLSLGLSDLQKS